MLINLDKLPLGSTAKIKCINCTGIIKTRLQDLGLVEDTPIVSILCSPLGDPTAYEFRGSIIAIRSDEAKQIIVETM